MNIYITSGTMDFMERLRDKHLDKTMVLMHGEGTSLLVHETEGRSIFQAPRSYEVISATGKLEEVGYFVFNNIPISDEGRPTFEHRFQTQAGLIESEPGFIAFRLLRPLNSNTYIVMTEWIDASYFQKWENSSSYKRVHESIGNDAGNDKTLHIFSSASYVTKYTTKNSEKT